MLKDFFQLNGEPVELSTIDELKKQLDVSDHSKNLLYRPDVLDRPRRIYDKTFENCSFTKTEIRDVIFRRCRFKDCLFIGTAIVDCEFHDCHFEGVNTHKLTIRSTYINPECFASLLSPKDHANIGVHLFQQLLANAATDRQFDFAHSAEYHLRRWKRFLVNYEHRKGEISWFEWIRKWLPDVLYHYSAGYGLRARFFASWTLLILLAVPLLNYRLWDLLMIHGHDGLVSEPSFAHAFYFSVVTIATVGCGEFVPTSQAGMWIVGIETLGGVFWLSLFASTIIKRIAR